MLKKTTFHVGSIAAILMLGACTMSQQAAPVVEGTTSSTTTTPPSSNPYGAAPYNPATAGATVSGNPYTPPPSSNRPISTGTYIPSNAPVDIHAATHTVIRGDTVYNISKRYQINQTDLRAWNNLSEDNNITVGQVLRVKPAGYVAPSRSGYTPPPVVVTPPPATTTTTVVAPPTPPSTTNNNNMVSSNDTRTVSGITWQRPTAGNVITQYNSTNKGVDIAGSSGQAVVAAADGKVVYAGSGLRGYGNLVIVQHTPAYLTAYGHNESLLVSEGQTVKRGQTIALMGKTDADRVKLHFEVRQDGKPVNPNTFIPF